MVLLLRSASGRFPGRVLIREIDEHALIALVLKFSQAPSRVLQREQEAFLQWEKDALGVKPRRWMI